MKGTWITETNLRQARDAIKSFRIELETGEPWLDGDDMVNVQRVWERDKLEPYAESLGNLEDTLTGLLAECFEIDDEVALGPLYICRYAKKCTRDFPCPHKQPHELIEDEIEDDEDCTMLGHCSEWPEDVQCILIEMTSGT